MKIALIGASGFTGTAILNEAVGRGHAVLALARHPERIAAHARVTAQQVDVNDVGALSAQLRDADVVISAYSGHSGADVLGDYMEGFRAIVKAVRQAGALRLLIVGGAGSLEVAPGVQLIDTPQFPDAYRATAEGARRALAALRDEASLDWTMLSPSAMLAPGPRTGVFRTGGDALLVDGEGNSAISVDDFAVAMLDEAEQGAHRRRRFTVGY